MIQYDKYKDSGIEWIGEIPEHWEVKRVATLGSFSKGKGIPRSDLKDEGYPAILYGDIYTKYNIKAEEIFNHINEETTHSSVIIEKNDLLFTGSGETKEDIGKCITYLGNQIVYAGGDVIILIQKKCDSLFLSYSLNSNISVFQKARMAKGQIIIHIYSSNIREIILSLPQKEEQTAIANFLDRKTAEIDNLITKKEKLLKLYDEEKTAVINQAVTKGVPRKDGRSSVSYKDSGIDWLGEIPEHWEVKKLKYVLNERMKYGANESALYENRNDPRYIRITDFGNDGKLRNNTFKSLPPEVAKDYMLKQGDILFARSGATVGKTFQFKDYNGMACFAGYLIKASPNYEIIISDFLYLFTKTSLYERWKESIFNQATIQNIGADKYVYLNIPIPKTEEQTAIVKFIETELNRINAKAEKTKKLIDLLVEYKQSLISEVVTGKLKVI